MFIDDPIRKFEMSNYYSNDLRIIFKVEQHITNLLDEKRINI